MTAAMTRRSFLNTITDNMWDLESRNIRDDWRAHHFLSVFGGVAKLLAIAALMLVIMLTMAAIVLWIGAFVVVQLWEWLM